MARRRAPKGGLVFRGKRYKGGQILPANASQAYAKVLDEPRKPRFLDPARGDPDNVPNFSRPPIPHVVTFRGLLTSLSKAYRYSDESLRHSVENAHMMRQDPTIMQPLFARQMMVSLMNWSIESENDKDPKLKEVASILGKLIARTPHFQEYRRNLMEAIWYGRYAVGNAYGFYKGSDNKKYRVIRKWTPYSGDKLLFRYDDGSGDYNPDQVGIRVSAALTKNDRIAGQREFEATADGLGYFFRGWERKQITLHRHFVMDGEFENPVTGGMVHGVGLRHFIYWVWYQKQETLAQIMELVDRTGMGFTIYYFDSGNPRSKAEMEEVAQNQAHTNIILMPYDSSDPNKPYIEQIPPNTQGLEVLRDVVENYFGDMIVRFILGQTLSTRAQATGMNEGISALHKDSLMQIVAYDANNLQETLTTELLLPLRDLNFPQYRNVDFWFKISSKSAAPDQQLAAIQQAWSMGARINVQELYEILDLPKPDSEDCTVFNPQLAIQIEAIEESQHEGATAQDVMQMMQGAGAPGQEQIPPEMMQQQAQEELPPEEAAAEQEMPPEETGEQSLSEVLENLDEEEGDEDGPPDEPPPDDQPPSQDSRAEEEERTKKLFGPILHRKYARPHKERVQIAEARTDRNLTEAQRKAGNYSKGRLHWNGLTIVIETPEGEKRHEDWKPMTCPYGYILRMPKND